MNTLSRIGAMLGLSMLAVALPMTTATAGEPDRSGVAEAQHCAVNLATGEAACDDDRTEAARQAGTDAAVKLVTLYDFRNYSGGSLTLWGPRPCSPEGDDEYQFGFELLDDRASSLRTFNQCDVKLFDRPDCTGPSSPWIDRSPDLGTIGWDNRASCVTVT